MIYLCNKLIYGHLKQWHNIVYVMINKLNRFMNFNLLKCGLTVDAVRAVLFAHGLDNERIIGYAILAPGIFDIGAGDERTGIHCAAIAGEQECDGKDC